MISYDFFDTAPSPTQVVVNASQLTENIRYLQQRADRPALAAVKANGYGHGYANAARAFIAGGASYLGVARLSEGLLLRQLGFTVPVLIIGGLLPSEMMHAAAAQIDFFVWSIEHIRALQQIQKSNHLIRVHIKVDTGMGRLGCFPEDVVGLAQALQSVNGVEFTGLATHLSSADILSVPDTLHQIMKFDEAIAALAAVGMRPKIIHVANSAGTLYHSRTSYDMIRVGITAYGSSPDASLSLPEGVRPALTWRTQVVSSKVLPMGHGVSYGSEFRCMTLKHVGVLPVGYGDGFRRLLNVDSVLIEGQECKVLGHVCMDHSMVDLDGLGDVTGAEAILIGGQGDSSITATDLAKRWGTNAYDVYTSIATRVPRHIK